MSAVAAGSAPGMATGGARPQPLRSTPRHGPSHPHRKEATKLTKPQPHPTAITIQGGSHL